MATIATRHPRQHGPSLQRFVLEDLAPLTREGTFSSIASRDFHLFYVGRDDVHGILEYLLSRATTSLYQMGRPFRCRFKRVREALRS